MLAEPIIHEFDVYSLRALRAGKASESQQKQAYLWILSEACQFSGICPSEASPLEAARFEGRRQVGFLILQMDGESALTRAKDYDKSLHEAATRQLPRGRKRPA